MEAMFSGFVMPHIRLVLLFAVQTYFLEDAIGRIFFFYFHDFDAACDQPRVCCRTSFGLSCRSSCRSFNMYACDMVVRDQRDCECSCLCLCYLARKRCQSDCSI